MDDFDRDVYCLLGLPLDAVDMAQAVHGVRVAAGQRAPCFVSTPNLNFLIGSQADQAFRNSVINSDLSLVDGLPLVWMARWLGIPIRQRVTGSGLFEALSANPDSHENTLSVYFFGGPEGMAEAACRSLNAASPGLRCAGFQCPGFGSLDDMSGDATIACINASGADFLVVSLGARKGQAWIERNRARITVSVISHLGAVVNFVAGSVRRAPGWVQRAGLEWLWRIKEEPALWRRYWRDGVGLLRLAFSRLLPYGLWLRFGRSGRGTASCDVSMDVAQDSCRIRIVGDVPDPVPEAVRRVLREAALLRLDVTVDCADAGSLGPGCFGLLLLLRKHQSAAGRALKFAGMSAALRRLFRWNGVDYLLDGQAMPAGGPLNAERA